MPERILLIKCNGSCRYLHEHKDPFDGSVGFYCSYNPHSAWEQITPMSCERCDREGRFEGISREEIIHRLTRTLKGCTSGDCVETAEYVLDTLLEMSSKL